MKITQQFIMTSSFVLALAALASSGDTTYTIEATKDGFKPTVLEVPANQKVKVVVKNSDALEIEFESYELNREEKIAPGSKKEIFIGPLKVGSYPFFDENNPASKGTVVVK